MQRLHNLTKWFLLPEGHSMLFEGLKQRMVTIDVNCPGEVLFYVVQDPESVEKDPERLNDREAGRLSPDRPAASVFDAKSKTSDTDRAITFLGLAKGRDRFEFGVEGPFELCCEGGSPMVYSADSTDTSTHVTAPVIFTRIANRRARNPQLELMQYQMRRNSEALYSALEAESTRRIDAMERRLESYAAPRNSGTALERPTRPSSEEPAEQSAAAVGTGAAPPPESGGGGGGGKKGKTAKSADDSGTFD